MVSDPYKFPVKFHYLCTFFNPNRKQCKHLRLIHSERENKVVGVGVKTVTIWARFFIQMLFCLIDSENTVCLCCVDKPTNTEHGNHEQYLWLSEYISTQNRYAEVEVAFGVFFFQIPFSKISQNYMH